MALFSLSPKAIEAPSDYNRWLIPPAALAIHLCIGQAYAFSVFRIPMTRIIGITETTNEDWQRTQVFWAFTLGIVFLGLSAAVMGRWVERVGPRLSGLVAAVCWSGGFLIGALAIWVHNIWLFYLGYGVLGGCGLGIGYITPVSTLIKWFPDHRGLATGLAIMGFGGGAMIASPLSEILMKSFSSPESTGVAQSLFVMGLGYLVVMTIGAFGFRLPQTNKFPETMVEPTQGEKQNNDTGPGYLDPTEALKTRVFYLLWIILFLNVTAGIGILDVASPMIQEMFPGKVSATTAAGFVGLLSLFNLAGRFAWSTASDLLGRRFTYGIFLSLGPLLYLLLPVIGKMGSVPLFVVCLAIIMSMYGGCFAAIPAYLSDVFGTRYVSAIHGRLLTAWSCAGIAGPSLINFIYQWSLKGPNGLESPERAYDSAIWFIGIVLCLGFLANLWVKSLVQPLALAVTGKIHFMETKGLVPIPWIRLALAWAAVGIPLIWGVTMTVQKTIPLFQSW